MWGRFWITLGRRTNLIFIVVDLWLSAYPLFEALEQMPIESKAAKETSARRFSDFVVYVDESGDHSLVSIDKDYPVFVLAFCVFHKRHYAEKIIPAMEKLKFNYFGHDRVPRQKRRPRVGA